MSQVLSQSLSDILSEAPTDLSAYVESKIDLNQRLKKYQPSNASDDTERFLQAFFKYLPADGKSHLAEDVLGCDTDLKLRQLGKSLETSLLLPMKALGGKSAEPTPSPRLGVEDSIEEPLSLDIKSINRDKQKGLRADCLRRDGNRCVVTGAYDINNHPPKSSFGPLQAVHIIPFALGVFDDDAARKRSSVIWNSITRYFPSIRSRLNFLSENINSHENVFMLLGALHDEFGAFRFSLSATATLSMYEVKTFSDFSSVFYSNLPANRLITLVCHDGRYRLPHPVLLETHNAIAHILHATGRAETIEKLQREYEERKFLAPGGGTDVEMLLALSSLALLEPGNKKSLKTRAQGEEEQKVKQQAEASHTSQKSGLK